jgi:hypothetical protein
MGGATDADAWAGVTAALRGVGADAACGATAGVPQPGQNFAPSGNFVPQFIQNAMLCSFLKVDLYRFYLSILNGFDFFVKKKIKNFEK